MPTIRWRVVCGLSETAATRSPTSRLSSVDLPAFGRPTSATVPQRGAPLGPASAIAQPTPAQPALEAIHLAAVALVVVAHAVQHAVQQEQLQLALERLLARRGLPAGPAARTPPRRRDVRARSCHRRETTARRSPGRGRESHGSWRAWNDRRTAARSRSPPGEPPRPPDARASATAPSAGGRRSDRCSGARLRAGARLLRRGSPGQLPTTRSGPRPLLARKSKPG